MTKLTTEQLEEVAKIQERDGCTRAEAQRILVHSLRPCPGGKLGLHAKDQLFSRSHFWNDDSSTDGLSRYCNGCMNEYKRRRYAKQGNNTNASYHQLKGSARLRGLEFNITFEQYQTLLSDARCEYGAGSDPYTGAIGLDRMNNSRGYVMDNVTPCCARHNQIKSDIFNHEEMLEVVAKYPGARNCAATKAGRKRLSGLPLQGRLIPSVAAIA